MCLRKGLLDVGWVKKSGDDESAEKGKKWLERTVWMGGYQTPNFWLACGMPRNPLG